MSREPGVDPLHDPRVRAVARSLRAARPAASEPGGGIPPLIRASVALVVRPEPSDLELLLIRRAEFPGDPWSGHMALPGGRHDPGDPDALATALRETREEVGIHLDGAGALLGPLERLGPRPGAPPVEISPFVFAVPAGSSTVTNHEVDLAVWIPLRHLAQPGAATEYLYALGDADPVPFPAYGIGEYVIWGLTYRILTSFLEITGFARQGEHGV